MPSKVIIIATKFMFLGINMFWALFGAHFSSGLEVQAKTSLTQAQNLLMPANINSVVLILIIQVI